MPTTFFPPAGQTPSAPSTIFTPSTMPPGQGQPIPMAPPLMMPGMPPMPPGFNMVPTEKPKPTLDEVMANVARKGQEKLAAQNAAKLKKQGI